MFSFFFQSKNCNKIFISPKRKVWVISEELSAIEIFFDKNSLLWFHLKSFSLFFISRDFIKIKESVKSWKIKKMKFRNYGAEFRTDVLRVQQIVQKTRSTNLRSSNANNLIFFGQFPDHFLGENNHFLGEKKHSYNIEVQFVIYLLQCGEN